MRNLLRNLLSSCLVAALVVTVACVKPILVPIADGGRPAEAGVAADSGLAPDCPPALCTPPSTTDTCDPVCQTGCNSCNQKCSYPYDDFTSKPMCAPTPIAPSAFFGPCATSTLTRDDVCVPGAICLDPTNGGALEGLCFRLCRSEAECAAVACSERKGSKGTGPLVCDPHYDSCALAGNCCDPLAGATGAAATASKVCPPGQFCYLVSPDEGHSRTVCDYTVGGSGIGQNCGASRDCFQKLTCVGGLCRQVCNTSSSCVSGTCSKESATEEYGYCSG
jgi:hypothetical protein